MQESPPPPRPPKNASSTSNIIGMNIDGVDEHVNHIAENSLYGAVSSNNGTTEVPKLISGADIYITVKRKRNQRSPEQVKSSILPVTTSNRFSKLSAVDIQKPSTSNEPVLTKNLSTEKPTPFYIRGGQNTIQLRKWMANLNIVNFNIKVLRQGEEAKMQLESVDDYRMVQKFFLDNNVPYFTYQLKSSRSIRAVIKGVDPRAEPEEIIHELTNLGYNIRSVNNIRNRKNEKTSMFMIELEPDNVKTNGPHPIFRLNRFMHMIVNVEAPMKNNKPKQCYNCQEFGHTKNMCRLSAICVICAERHHTSRCDKDKSDDGVKKCNNCGEKHTANWKGCAIYQSFLERMNPKQRREQRIARNMQEASMKTPKRSSGLVEGLSYAKVASEKPFVTASNEALESNDIIKLIFMMQTNMAALQANINEMVKKQNTMESTINAISVTLSKLSKSK